MADSELPIDSVLPYYEMGTTIEGRNYLFNMRWNEWDQSWYFDLLDPDVVNDDGEAEPIVSGIKVVLGAQLGRRSTDPRMPNGSIFASDLSGAGKEAGRNDLGTRVKLYFRPAADLAL